MELLLTNVFDFTDWIQSTEKNNFSSPNATLFFTGLSDACCCAGTIQQSLFAENSCLLLETVQVDANYEIQPISKFEGHKTSNTTLTT